MYKLLIPTDFSQNAWNAVKYGMDLFKYEACEIFIMHAYADEVFQLDPFMEPAQLKEVQNRILKQANSELASIEKQLKSFSPNPRHKILTIAEFGSLIDEANDLVELENIDLIIMGTRGKAGDKKLTFGSNTLQVMKYVKCPVLAIPENYNDINPVNILFPSDLMIPYKKRELKLVRKLAKRYAAMIHLLYVSGSNRLSLRQQNNKAFIDSIFTGVDADFEHITGNDTTEAINNFIEEKNIDLLVMVNSRHSYLESVLYDSKIEKIGLEVQIPFLVLQNLPRN
ncbi:nucleotide-binding universal stress UspA family protein [Christiangramia gaetbulicola]|uniref:Nucleotide-binding universal stress UspA family protein n=1 Tax=Christiangramia gaetbulicola TaxID=703340 RepID=A0A2T6AHK2_9FLAO|nr:universal stress protein [Christiangramia gaetbulicola]PTX43257.1 nucleotide-binding universal stress UspA family protein [Christiangramia gaetbulicola]